jgi:hypothetical protein
MGLAKADDTPTCGWPSTPSSSNSAERPAISSWPPASVALRAAVGSARASRPPRTRRLHTGRVLRATSRRRDVAGHGEDDGAESGSFSGQAGNFLFDLGLGDGTLVGHPGVAVDNTDAVYQLDIDPALSADEIAFNQAIVRVASDPQRRRPAGMANIPVVKGTPRIPVLTLHDLGDLFVPFKMEIDYAQRGRRQRGQ